jgi:hypothetical protein
MPSPGLTVCFRQFRMTRFSLADSQVARWSPVPALSLNCMWIEARAEPPDPGSGRS